MVHFYPGPRASKAFRLSAHASRRSCRGYDYPASSRLRMAFCISEARKAFRLSAHAYRRSWRGYDYPASSRLQQGISLVAHVSDARAGAMIIPPLRGSSEAFCIFEARHGILPVAHVRGSGCHFVYSEARMFGWVMLQPADLLGWRSAGCVVGWRVGC